MDFYEYYKKWEDFNFDSFFSTVTPHQVNSILKKDKLTEKDYLALLAPTARKKLEPLARKAHLSTVQHFGRVIFLYAPLYLANYCDSECLYCGFNVHNNFTRDKLSLSEVKKEARALRDKGLQHILLLTGCSREKTPVAYIKECVAEIRDMFASLAIEVYALKTREYRSLIESGVEGLTIYQEVYDQKRYSEVHPGGPKSNYQFRLQAPERGCRAGMRAVNIGALLGLGDWRREAFMAGLHAAYLQDKYPEVSINLSVPRLQPHLGNFEPDSVVSNQNLVQIILAFRLFLPRVGINLSTRETEELQDNLLPLGITKFSAESSTAVGGYTSEGGTSQFEISDQRSVEQIKKLLLKKGYQPVFKNWHQNII
ncbi:MAG: 2-iminoacetate synthase ThiH [Bacillota bacterium]